MSTTVSEYILIYWQSAQQLLLQERAAMNPDLETIEVRYDYLSDLASIKKILNDFDRCRGFLSKLSEG